MVTKTFCDHCGNVARDVTVLSFGGVKQHLSYETQRMQAAVQMHIHAQQNAVNYGGGGAGGAGGVGVAQSLAAPPKPPIEIIDVDLCPHCVNLWMNRVKAITRGSDPE